MVLRTKVMRVRDLIEKLQQFDPELEVTITDGYEAVCYHTKGSEIKTFQFPDEPDVVDIGVGGLRL